MIYRSVRENNSIQDRNTRGHSLRFEDQEVSQMCGAEQIDQNIDENDERSRLFLPLNKNELILSTFIIN